LSFIVQLINFLQNTRKAINN